jgi:AcrR family transcriptional regulator
MPKRVDHEERRRDIAAALLRVVSRDGLDAVSLRHVAAEAGVTAGMVQHYFPSKEHMLQHAMGVASERYEQRITDRLGALGVEPDPVEIIRVLIGGLIPHTAAEAEDARIALAFQAYAANNPAAAARLSEGNRILTEHIAELLGAVGADTLDRALTATMLLATAEGLAIATLSAELPPIQASQAIDALLALLSDPTRPQGHGILAGGRVRGMLPPATPDNLAV